MTHDRVKNLLTDFAAGELGPLAAWRVRRHLARCPSCAREWERTRSLWSDLRATAVADAPPAPVWMPQTIPAPATDDRETTREERIPMRRRFVLPALAASAVMAAAVLPLSGWLVKNQLQVAFGAGMEHLGALISPSAEDTAARYEAVAQRFPDDFPVQLGLALRQTEGGPRREALFALAERFPNEPALYAALLNSDYSRLVKTPSSPADKGEPWRLPPDAPEAKPYSEESEEVISCARRGEKTDPENAFFPLMEAYGLLAAGRPNAAMEAVRRAGTKPRFTDYWGMQMDALWQAHTAVHGEVGTLGRMARTGGLFPHAAVPIRSAARAAFGHALALELEGKAREGLELRAALLRVAVRMQNDPTSYMSNLYGSAVAAVAQNRPGGAPKIEAGSVGAAGIDESERDYRLAVARAEAFSAFAARHGRPELGALAKANADAGRKQKAILRRVQEKHPLMVPGLEYSGLLLGISLLLLFGALWTIFFGGIAFALGRTGRIRRGDPLHPAIRLGFWLTLPPVLLGIGLSVPDPFTRILLPLGALVWTAALFLRLRRIRGDEKQARAVGLMFGTAIATLATVLVAGLLVMGPLAMAERLRQELGMRAAVPSPDSPAGPEGILTGLICLFFPLLMVFVLALRSRKKEIPASVGIVREFRRLAVPMASILLLLYAGSAVWAAWMDARLRGELTVYIRHEGRYMARVAGEEWPLVKE